MTIKLSLIQKNNKNPSNKNISKLLAIKQAEITTFN